jgi:hypothetical protein
MARCERSVGGGADVLVTKRKLRRDGPGDGAGDRDSDRPARHPRPAPGKASRGEAARCEGRRQPARGCPSRPADRRREARAAVFAERAAPRGGGRGGGASGFRGRPDLRASAPRSLGGAAVRDRRAARGKWPRAFCRCHANGRCRPAGSLRDDPGAGSVLSNWSADPAGGGRRRWLAGCSRKRDQRRCGQGPPRAGVFRARHGQRWFGLRARRTNLGRRRGRGAAVLAVGDGGGRVLPSRTSRWRGAVRAWRAACEILISSRDSLPRRS